MLADRNIVENAVNSADHTTLVAAVTAAGLVETLSGEGPFTVFAPTNDAFAKLPAGTVESLLEPANKDQLTKILTCHVVGANVMAEAVVSMISNGGGMATVDTLGGCKLEAKLDGESVTLTDENGNVATVTIADVKQSNGVIHVIDTVVLPASDMQKSESMGDDGSMMKSDNPMVGGAAMFADRNIVENAVNSADHTTLVAAVKAAGLVETLSGDGPFTVFAPTNAAFGNLPAGTVETLLEPANKDQLTKVLTAHVVAGKVTAADLVEKARAHGGRYNFQTVSGDALTAEVSGHGTVWIYDESGGAAKVEIADVMQSNGIIHSVNDVLLPR